MCGSQAKSKDILRKLEEISMIDTSNIKFPAWQLDAKTPDEYHCCEMRRGREFLVRMMTGADPSLAIARFAKENNIRFGKVHATFMGGFQPCKYYVWIPDYKDPDNWHREGVAVNTNLTMLTSIGGMIGERPVPGTDKTEPFVAMHFVAGGGWDAPTITGHLVEGTLVKGCMQVFITELLDVDVLAPIDVVHDPEYGYPENFYYNTKQGKPE